MWQLACWREPVPCVFRYIQQNEFTHAALQQSASILGYQRVGLKFLRITAEKQKSAGGNLGIHAVTPAPST